VGEYFNGVITRGRGHDEEAELEGNKPARAFRMSA